MNIHQVFRKPSKETFTLHEVNFGRPAKIFSIFYKEIKFYIFNLYQSFINSVAYHPMNPDADVTYQRINLFSPEKCFIYFIYDVPHYIRWNQHNTVCTVLVKKVDVLDTCGAIIFSYFGITFLLFFTKIENAVYTCFQNSMLLFINGLIFDIMNIGNNQFLEFERIPMLALLRSVSDQRFSWLCNVFLKSFQGWLNSVQQCQGNFTKKILAKKCSYCCKHT